MLQIPNSLKPHLGKAAVRAGPRTWSHCFLESVMAARGYSKVFRRVWVNLAITAIAFLGHHGQVFLQILHLPVAVQVVPEATEYLFGEQICGWY